MRRLPLTLAALQLAALAGCTTGPENVAGDAGPAGTPSAITNAPALPSVPAAAIPPSTSAASPSISRAGSSPTGATSTSVIRKTNWSAVTIVGVGSLGDLAFKDGQASSGAQNCTMLPGGARPYYGEYLAEEPANSPVTEDALVLIDCGSDAQQQMLVPVQLGFNQKTRHAVGFIKADPPPGPGKSMTFVSYRVEKGAIVTVVRKADGSTEKRRYGFDGAGGWERI